MNQKLNCPLPIMKLKPKYPNRTTWIARLCVVGGLFALVCCSADVNKIIETVWKTLQASSIFRHDSFEPMLAVTTFFFAILFWRFIDLHGSYFQKYRIEGAEHVQLPWQIMKPGVCHVSALAYLLPIFLFDAVYPRRHLKLNIAAPSWQRIAVEVCVTVFLYDLFFYVVHWMLHNVRGLYFIHAKHHQKPLSSVGVIRHSFIDGSMQVLVNIWTLNLVNAHPLCRALHNIVVITMLTETHCGYDMPWMLHNVCPFGVFGGSPRHELHHKHGNVYYHQFFTYLDDYFGYTQSLSSVRETVSNNTSGSDPSNESTRTDANRIGKANHALDESIPLSNQIESFNEIKGAFLRKYKEL